MCGGSPTRAARKATGDWAPVGGAVGARTSAMASANRPRTMPRRMLSLRSEPGSGKVACGADDSPRGAGVSMGAAEPGVHGLGQPLAEEVEREDGEREDGARDHRQVRKALEVLEGVGDQHPPGRDRPL